jgi:HEPN domain-containing protein
MGKQTNVPKEWRLLAERDMAAAEYLANMYPPLNEIIAYHCQQATEKYLKGVLASIGEAPPYIHNLDELCLSIEKHLPSFSTISALCTRISQFAVQPRYDFGISLSDTDMRLVLEHTKKIIAFLEKETPALFQK